MGQVLRQVREAGGIGLRWWVRPDTRPEDMDARLKDYSYRLEEDVDVLTWDLGTGSTPSLPPFPEPESVTTAQVLDDASLWTFRGIQSETFPEEPPPSEAAMATFVQELREAVQTGVWNVTYFLAYVDGEPAASAGVTLVGEVAQFWGAGTLPTYRGRGAYAALVLARCRWAHAHGAAYAVVRARKGTSGPILLRHGFSELGSERCYVAPKFDG